MSVLFWVCCFECVVVVKGCVLLVEGVLSVLTHWYFPYCYSLSENIHFPCMTAHVHSVLLFSFREHAFPCMRTHVLSVLCNPNFESMHFPCMRTSTFRVTLCHVPISLGHAASYPSVVHFPCMHLCIYLARSWRRVLVWVSLASPGFAYTSVYCILEAQCGTLLSAW